MKKCEKVFFELILIISGVLVFRSLWTMMDMIPMFNQLSAHAIFLIIGILLSSIAIKKIYSKK